MFDSSTPELAVAQIIFWALLPFALLAPPRWAVLSWLIMGNLDATEPGFSSASSFGWINVVKGVGIPLVLWMRLGNAPSRVLNTVPAKLWIGLAAYASVAALWTPFPLAAVKLVGSMAGILITILVLEKAARTGLLTGTVLSLLICSTILLGVFQTYYFGGLVYGYDGPDQQARFSSFIHAQQYAAILVAFFTLILWREQLRQVQRLVLGLATLAALALNGSRTWFIGAIIAAIVFCFISFRRVALIAAFGVASVSLAALALANLTSGDIDWLSEAPSRIVATSKALLSGEDTAQRAGLRNLSFRFIVYDGVVEELRSAGPRELIFGHGTSSGGTVSLRLFPHVYNADHLDPNRTIHNEWLRALYEWGLVGLALLVSVFGSLTVGVVRAYRESAWKPPYAALLSFLPAFLAALSTENIIAGVGNAVTFSLALLIGLLFVPPPRRSSAAECLLPVRSIRFEEGRIALTARP